MLSMTMSSVVKQNKVKQTTHTIVMKISVIRGKKEEYCVAPKHDYLFMNFKSAL